MARDPTACSRGASAAGPREGWGWVPESPETCRSRKKESQAPSPRLPLADLVFRVRNLWSRLPLSHHPSETDTQEMEGEKIKNLFIAQLALGMF